MVRILSGAQFYHEFIAFILPLKWDPDSDKMIGSNESALLIAFARAGSKAQEIEAILQETLMGVEVVTDTRGVRSQTSQKKLRNCP